MDPCTARYLASSADLGDEELRIDSLLGLAGTEGAVLCLDPLERDRDERFEPRRFDEEDCVVRKKGGNMQTELG